MKIRAIYNEEQEDGSYKKVKSQWFNIWDFDPVNGYRQFDWSDGMYLGFDEVDWKKELEWEFK